MPVGGRVSAKQVQDRRAFGQMATCRQSNGRARPNGETGVVS